MNQNYQENPEPSKFRGVARTSPRPRRKVSREESVLGRLEAFLQRPPAVPVFSLW
jgi:hypothetical protein